MVIQPPSPTSPLTKTPPISSPKNAKKPFDSKHNSSESNGIESNDENNLNQLKNNRTPSTDSATKEAAMALVEMANSPSPPKAQSSTEKSPSPPVAKKRGSSVEDLNEKFDKVALFFQLKRF
jgi:hypothetical protein